MDRRASSNVAVRAIALAAAALLAATPARAELSRTYAEVVGAEVTDEPPVTLRWSLRISDMLSCRSMAASLRQARADYGNRVRIQVVAIDVRPEYMESYLRNERLWTNVEVDHTTSREYRVRYPADQPATISVLPRGGVITRFAATGASGGGLREISDLRGVLRDIFMMGSVAVVSNRTPAKGGN